MNLKRPKRARECLRTQRRRICGSRAGESRRTVRPLSAAWSRTSRPLRNPSDSLNPLPTLTPWPPTSRPQSNPRRPSDPCTQDTLTRTTPSPRGSGVTCGNVVGPGRRRKAQGQALGLSGLRGRRPQAPPQQHCRQRRRRRRRGRGNAWISS